MIFFDNNKLLKMDWGNLNTMSRTQLLDLARQSHIRQASGQSNSQLIRVLLSEQRRSFEMNVFVDHLRGLSFVDLKDYARELGIDTSVPLSKVELLEKIRESKLGTIPRGRNPERGSHSSRDKSRLKPGKKISVSSFADFFEQIHRLGVSGDYEFVLNFSFAASEFCYGALTFDHNWNVRAVASGYPLRGGEIQLNITIGELCGKIENDQSGLNEFTILNKGSVVTVSHVERDTSHIVKNKEREWKKFRFREARRFGKSCSKYFVNESIVCFSSHNSCFMYSKLYCKRNGNRYPVVSHVCCEGNLIQICRKDTFSYPTICLVRAKHHYIVLKKPLGTMVIWNFITRTILMLLPKERKSSYRTETNL